MCDIISATKSLGWVAVKLTDHRHDAAGPGHATDTDRYLAAGAREALLLHSTADIPDATNRIIESNAVLGNLKPDLFVFVIDPENAEWKQSAVDVVARADIVIEREFGPDTLRRVVERLSG